jgi:hypothetical protein
MGGKNMVVAHHAVADGASLRLLSPPDDDPAERRDGLGWHLVRASGLAQARLQLAVLAGNRRRALEQIDRLVALDRKLERMSGDVSDNELAADLADQRLAIASEKMALISAIELPRLEPAFGAGMGAALAPEEQVEIVDEEVIRGGALRAVLWGAAFIALCAGATAAVLLPF